LLFDTGLNDVIELERCMSVEMYTNRDVWCQFSPSFRRRPEVSKYLRKGVLR